MPLAQAHQSWLNPRRLSAQGLSLALGLWIIYAWVMFTPGLRDRNGLIKGTDFLHFYTLGLLARAHQGADLYNMPEQTRLLAEHVPTAAGTVYLPLYGPQVSILFAPFAALPYSAALIAWWLCSTSLYAACVYAVWRTCADLSPYGWTVFWIAAAYPAFFHLIAWGQTSALALVCFTAGYLFLRRERMFCAGLALGCLMFKPQLGLVVALVFCVTQAWRLVAGALITSTGQLLLGWLYYGTAVMRDYASHISQAGNVLRLLEPRIEQTHCLRTFWQMLIPWPGLAWGLYATSMAVVLWLTLRCWRTTLPLALRYSVILLATVLVSPHLTVYDLVILAPAILLLSDWILSLDWSPPSRQFVVLLYLVYLLPLIGILARWTHVQLSVIAISILLWLICSAGNGRREVIA
jgi:Glycosyltransferase family 87